MSVLDHLDQRTSAQKKLDEKIKNRVLRGIDFLKKQYGEDWVEHIDLEMLDLENGSRCVLGQLHRWQNDTDDVDISAFYDEVVSLGWDTDPISPNAAVIKYGFLCPPENSNSTSYYERLTNMWHCAITKLREHQSPEDC